MPTATKAKKEPTPAPAETAGGGKCIVSGAALLRQLLRIAPAVSNSPVVPICAYVLLACANSTLTLTATDLEITLTAGPLPVEARGEWRLAVPARKLIETLKALPDQPLTLDMDAETGVLEIRSGNGRYRLTGGNPGHFPTPKAFAPTTQLTQSSALLARALGKTLPFVSGDDLRPAMTGVLIEITPAGRLTFVATDGQRLSRYRQTLPLAEAGGEPDTRLVLSGRVGKVLRSALPTEAEPVAMAFTPWAARFELPGLTMDCRLIDERYPDYENVLPQRNPIRMLLDRADLLAALRRMQIYANKTTHQARLACANNEMTLSAEDLDFSIEANERLACQHEGAALEIGFNTRFLIEQLGILETAEVLFEMSGPNRAGLLTPAEQEPGEELLLLVMPVMLNSYVSE